jgi:hypothetical protein
MYLPYSSGRHKDKTQTQIDVDSDTEVDVDVGVMISKRGEYPERRSSINVLYF